MQNMVIYFPLTLLQRYIYFLLQVDIMLFHLPLIAPWSEKHVLINTGLIGVLYISNSVFLEISFDFSRFLSP
jgi:hypothetical protein